MRVVPREPLRMRSRVSGNAVDRPVTHEVNREAFEQLRLHLWHQRMIDRLHHGRVYGHVTGRESEARHNLYARLYRRQIQGRRW